MLYPAIFLDRDGTIIEDNGYISSSHQIEFYSFTFEALQSLQRHFMLFIITNQSGVSKSLISEEQVVQVNSEILRRLNDHEIYICDTFYCPHSNEDNCNCKKPKPFFIEQAAALYAIDLSKSFMIGDHPSDVECGINAGVTPIYLLSGHGQNHFSELNQKTVVCQNLLEASAHIISTIKN